MRIHVVFSSTVDAPLNQSRFLSGLAADELPYGIEHLRGRAADVTYSLPRRSRAVGALARASRRFLKIELIQAILDIPRLRRADAIYCHTEYEYVAVGILLRILFLRRPLLVGQTIWTGSRRTRSRWVRHHYDAGATRVDLFVHNSRANLEFMSSVYPNQEHVFVPFGCSNTFFGVDRRAAAVGSGSTRPVVISVGNDEFRDWKMLSGVSDLVTEQLPDVSIRAVTAYRPADFKHAALQFEPARSRVEMVELYRSTPMVVILTLPNLHASGITVALEAAAVGAPVLCNEGSGIEDYFPDSALILTPRQSTPDEIAAAIITALCSPASLEARGRRLHEHARSEGFSLDGYWARVAELLDEKYFAPLAGIGPERT